MIKVLVVEDSVFMRTILIDILSSDPSINVVGTAENGLIAIEKIKELSPDVITLDIEMPEMNGIETLRTLESYKVRPKILMLSTLTEKDADLTKEALSLGADDFMLKPRNLGKVRGIQNELIEKVKHLITIPIIYGKKKHDGEPAKKIVIIGSSAGGPPMLDIIVSALKPDINAAILITQHMPVGFTAALAKRLDKISPLNVLETENGQILKKGYIYVSKAGFHSIVSATLTGDGKKGGKIIHSKSPMVHAVRPAVDKTFISAAKVFGTKALSVILSGMGSDGGEGMQEIKENGGRTIIVREDECLVYGMARSAIKRESVDKIISLKFIPREITRIVSDMEE
ncbi:MAG: chemotaxis-specific protein-glutamate methyltransferase CheB [Euryarchaeota archaeon]|nr:chemotaxis-specific protein-glutamate methyltransferase CheB [Euryarchaeota archaeon]